MAWLRDVGVESFDIIVKSDNETHCDDLDHVVERVLRAMKTGARIVVENTPMRSLAHEHGSIAARQRKMGSMQFKTWSWRTPWRKSDDDARR